MQTLADDLRHAEQPASGGHQRNDGEREARNRVRSAAGLALGAVLAWVLSRAIVTLAFDVTITDPLVWATTTAVVSVATLLAAWRPAVTAMRADPLILLRNE